MLKFKNPALKPFIILLFAFSFNDALSTPVFGGIPVTPVQIAVIYGIVYLFPKVKPPAPYIINKIKTPIILYYFVLAGSTILTFINSGFSLSFLTVGFNLLWFLTVCPFLSQGIDESDIKKFFDLFLKIILFITIPSGLYELITNQHIMNIGYGISETTFYLRGFHIDKLEFGSMLATGTFISLINFFNQNSFNQKIYYAIILFLSSLLIAFSFSTTSMMGASAGVGLILLYKSRKAFIFLPFILLFIYIFVESVKQSELFQEHTLAYELKYSLSVDQYEERNFRYQAIGAALERIMDEPIWGFGVGNSGYIIQETLGSEKLLNSHNLFANEILDFGLLGFIPLFIFLFRLYTLAFKSAHLMPNRYMNYSSLKMISIALSAFLIFRLLLYYHRFDQTFYFIWAALVVASYGTYIKINNNERKESTHLHPPVG